MRDHRSFCLLPFGASLLCALASAQTTTRVSVSSSGTQAAGVSAEGSMSSDGRYIVFRSSAANLVATDTNGAGLDVFVHDRATATTTLVSKSSTGVQPTTGSFTCRISGDGRYAAFLTTSALVPGDTNTFYDVFLHDLQTGLTTRESVGTGGSQSNGESVGVSLSADGRFVAFQSSANNLVAGDTNNQDDVFVHDRQTNVTTRVSVDSNGVEGNSASREPWISADGRYVVFLSFATNIDPTDTTATGDTFMHDMQTGVTTLVSRSSVGSQTGSISINARVSGDGRYVTFLTAGALVPEDTNNASDVYLRDTWTSTTTRVSVSTSGAQVGHVGAGSEAISNDGRFITFVSSDPDLAAGDTNGAVDVFVRDVQSGTTLRVDFTSSGLEAAAGASGSSISDDGRFVVLESGDSALVPGDTNALLDIFVRDRGQAVVINSFCFGDGLDARVTTPCPCANFGAPGHGCGNSVVTTGALLSTSGVQPDDVQLTTTDMPPGVTSIYLQGNLIDAPGVVFGDGVRCAAGQLLRLGARTDTDFDGSTTLGPASGDAQILVTGHVLDGGTYAYQTYYRNPDASWCPPATFNVSQAVAITW